MCETCGCAATEKDAATVEVIGRLLAANDQVAGHNRGHFDSHGVVAFNLMSSPGAGKTALLEATIDALKADFRIAVIEGDLETDNDARRIRAHGVPAVQITTGSACHLDAQMVHNALHDLPLAGLDIVFIENVGNLVCPAGFDLGQHRNVVLLSVTEGDDKPTKYPVMFRAADAMLLTKMDLAPVMDDFEPARAEQALRHLANAAPVIPVSARKAIDIDTWVGWLRGEIARVRSSHDTSVKPHEHHHHGHHDHHHHRHEHPAVA
ncbi:MAG: hydrogenase nickel incorporation protein HypB [Rhodopseudomonas sp.]|nr:hydrogenase nickel incorporation protein HypB [Rhodopseudomonas sp.]